jgi:hypothetical protein
MYHYYRPYLIFLHRRYQHSGTCLSVWSRNLREFLMQFVKSRASILSNFSPISFFKSSVTRDGRPDRSSSWTFVLPSLNIRHHFLTLDSFVTPSPFTAVSCLWMSIERTFCAFKKRITDRTSQSAGLLIFLIHFKHSLKLFKWCNRC